MNKQTKSTAMWLDIINDINGSSRTNNNNNVVPMYNANLSKLLLPSNIQKYVPIEVPVVQFIPSFNIQQKTSRNFKKLQFKD